MAIRLPTDTQSKWTQPNNSDKFGSLAYTKNINLDEEGYIKLSPRSVRVYSDVENADFGIPLAIGRHSEGAYQVATSSDANFQATIAEEQNTWAENDGSNNPTLTTLSHAVWFKGLWHATTATGVFHRPATGGSGQAWTSASIALTSGKKHYMAVFQSSVSLCVTNANTVLRYTENAGTYTLAATLTIPSDYEIIGLAYNKSKMAVATRLSNDGTDGSDQEVRLFIWSGASGGGDDDLSVGADGIHSVIPYKSSFALLTRTGELLYWNGGGFERLAAFPFFYEDKIHGNPLDTSIFEDTPMTVDGDIIYINIGLVLNQFGRKAETCLPNTPSGVWCFDPKVGLYHRWSPSVSPAYVNFVDGVDINTTTDVLTASAGVFGLETIPATGGIARLTAVTGIGGLTLNSDYYIIKVSATTFKLATTRANALAGTAIDITSATTGGSGNYFWMYDLVDYGNTFFADPSAVSSTGDTFATYRDIFLGGRLALTTTLDTNDAICLVVPFLENRGYAVTPKIFSSQVTDNNQKLFVKFRPLKTTDSIIVKYRERDIIGLPVTSSGDEATWTSPSEFYTVQDLSEAKTYLDAGGKLECELINGAGGGTMVQITSIDTDGTTYTVVLDEEVLGAASTLKAEFIIHNWKVIKTITSGTVENSRGYAEIAQRLTSKWIQYKIEMRGSDIAIEGLDIDNAVNQKL